MGVARSHAYTSETRTRWLLQRQSPAAERKGIAGKFAIRLELELDPKRSEVKERLSQQRAEATRRPKDEERHKILIAEETNGALSQLSAMLQRLMRGRV